MNTFLKTNHQLKRWLPSLKVLAIATSMTVGLAVSESVWASCTDTGSGFYCDINHASYPSEVACLATCVSAPTTYTLTLNTTGTGTGTVTGAGSYAAGTPVTLGATANAGSTFAGWSSGCSSGMALTANTTCTATFNKGDSTPPTPSTPPLPENMTIFLQVDGSGSGSVSTNTGLSCKREDCQPNLKSPGELVCQENCRQVVKTASDVTLTPKADANSVFSSWGGNQDCVDGQLTSITSSTLCIAYFHRLYKLTVAVEGPGRVTGKTLGYGSKAAINCGQGQTQCNNTYESTIEDSLQAQPLGNAQFQKWGGDCSGTETLLKLNLSKDATCQAIFIAPTTVKKLDQTIINFSPATSAVVGDQAILTATGGASNNPVTFASTTPEVCTVSGNTLKVAKAGTCTVTANQAGNDQYNPATQVTANIEVKSSAVVAKKDQIITNFVPATSATVNTDAALTAPGGASGNAVTFASTTPAICTVSGQTVKLVALGTCTVTANQAGNDQYNSAPTVTASIEVKSAAVVVKKDQVITNFSPTGYAFTVDKAMVNDQTTLTATGGASGNPVTYTSTTPEVCTVSGNTVSLIAVGTCTIKANQDGNDLYNPASPVTTAIQVNQPVETTAPTTSNWALVTTSTVGNSLTLTATGDTSANPVTFTSATPTVCTVSGNTVRLDAVGTCTVTANQAGNSTSTVVATITVTPVPATTTVPATTVSSTPVTSETPSTPPPSRACPNITEDNGVLIVSGVCDAKGEVFDKPVRILPGASISNVTFNNKVENEGLASNVTIGKNGEVTHGMLSGSVKSQGNVCNVSFVGSSFVGGTVCGKIQNDSKVGGCLKNVTALLGTEITGCVKKQSQNISFDFSSGTSIIDVPTGEISPFSELELYIGSITLPAPVSKADTGSYMGVTYTIDGDTVQELEATFTFDNGATFAKNPMLGVREQEKQEKVDTSISVEGTIKVGDLTIKGNLPATFTKKADGQYQASFQDQSGKVTFDLNEKDVVTMKNPVLALVDKNVTTVPATMTVKVFGTKTVDLVVTVTGAGKVARTPAGSTCSTDTVCTSYTTGDSVALSAIADTGSVFDKWSGDCAGQTGSLILITMDKAKICTATFKTLAATQTLTVSKTGNGAIKSDMGGIDCGTVCTATYPQGNSVNLTAIPDATSTFAGWGGDCVSAAMGNPAVVKMDAAKSCTATFNMKTQEATCFDQGGLLTTEGQCTTATPFLAESTAGTTSSLIKGGVSKNGSSGYGPYKSSDSVMVLLDLVKTAVVLKIDPADKGQKVDLVAVGLHTLTDTMPLTRTWYMLVGCNTCPLGWNVGVKSLETGSDALPILSALEAYKSGVTLDSDYFTMPLFEGSFSEIGTLDIYAGYRINSSGKLVINTTPIHIDIVPRP